MKVSDIDPYIRNVTYINFIPMQSYGRAGDCHFFLMMIDSVLRVAGTKYNLSKGAVVIIPAAVEYYFECTEPIHMITVNFDYTQSASHKTDPRPPRGPGIFTEDRITERPDFDDYTFLNHPIVLEGLSGLRDKVELMLEEFECKKQFYREVASSIFKNVIFEIMRFVMVGAKGNASVDAVLEYIHNHYSEDIDNESVARHVGYHSYYLNRLMKSVTGTTIHQYIMNYRIDIAKRYLHNFDLSILAISELCGYKSVSNFSVDFKKKTGMSPSHFRANLGVGV